MSIRSLSSSAVLVVLLLVSPAPAGTVSPYLGPLPYLSAADSPFDLSAPGFCLEDFEDGVLDTIGAMGSGSIVAPGGITDSVDGDDGAIDGSGLAGHSYFGGGVVTITFDPLAPGGLPTMAGMVWTDGGVGATISFEAFDALGASLGVHGPFDHADDNFSGGTAEDRFYGVIHAGGISAMTVSNTSGGTEIDHLQYNNCFDEVPSTTTTSSSTTTTSSSVTSTSSTTASTVTTTTTSTTTTLGGCAGEPVAPTFASLNCRLADLILATQAESALGRLQGKLVRAAQKAKSRKEAAEAGCETGNAKKAGRQLKKVVRKLIQFSHRLRARSARRKVPEEIREPLAASADAIQADAKTLRETLSCGADAEAFIAGAS